MDLTYEVLDGEDERNEKVKVGATGKEYSFRVPKFKDRDKIMGVIKKVQDNSGGLKKAVHDIANKRKIKSDDIMDMIQAGGGELTEEEMDMINEASAGSDISVDDQLMLIEVVLDMTDEEKSAFEDKLDIDEGIALAKAAMIFLAKCISPDTEERKK